MIHLGDISKIDGTKIPPVTVITFGSPCFPEGTLVLTDVGYKPIEQIEVGERVLTHTGQWHRVLKTGSKIAETIILKGNHYGLECTSNHPIFSKDIKRDYSDRKNRRIIGTEDKWIPAENMLGEYWATPKSAILPCEIKEPKNGFYRFPVLDEKFFYFIGRWLGDGWVRNGQRSKRPEGQTYHTIMLCDSLSKIDEIKKTVSAVTDKYSVELQETCAKVKFENQNLCDWLVDNFGKGAGNKKMPTWALTLPKELRKSLLQGIFDSDGYKSKPNQHRVTTISKNLAYCIKFLAESLDYSTSIFIIKPSKKKVIQGRTVNQQDYYVVQITDNGARHLHDKLHSWYKVRKIINTNEIKTVYNIEVEGDHSYVADGIVVHNCQNLSIAGKREGLAGEQSGLFMEAVRVIKEMRRVEHFTKSNEPIRYPKFAIWENVPGAFSSNNGEDFRTVLEELARISGGAVTIPKPEKGWKHSGTVIGDGYSIAWRLFDAQYLGVPQRRKRITLVMDIDGERAGEILFERTSVSGDIDQSIEAWKGVARNPSESIGERDCKTLQIRSGCDGGAKER